MPDHYSPSNSSSVDVTQWFTTEEDSGPQCYQETPDPALYSINSYSSKVESRPAEHLQGQKHVRQFPLTIPSASLCNERKAHS